MTTFLLSSRAMRNELLSTTGAAVVVFTALLACKAPPPSADGGAEASTSASASASAAKAGPPAVTDQAWVAGLLKDVASATTCPAKKPGFMDHAVLSGAWCGLDDFDKGERDGTLDDQGALFGFVVELQTDAPVAAALKKPTFAVLAVDKRSGDRFATMSTFTDTKGDYGDASQTVTDLLEGSEFVYRAEIPKKVWADANARSEKASSKIVSMPNGWHLEGPTTDIRRVGKRFYAIELTTPKSIRVGVFTDKSVEKK